MRKCFLLFILLTSTFSLLGCWDQMGTNEVGVVTNNLPAPIRWTKPWKLAYGVANDTISRGQFVIYIPGIQQIDKFDVSIKTMDIGTEIKISETDSIKGMRLKTKEGNNIFISVSVRYQLVKEKLPEIIRNFGYDHDIENKLIFPTVRSIVRTQMGKLTTSQFAIPDMRKKHAEITTRLLNERLNYLGVTIQKVNIPKPKYNARYEAKINEKEYNNQEAEKILSQQQAAKLEIERRIVETESTKQSRIEKAKGYFGSQKAKADSVLYQKQKEAEGIRKTMLAEAEGWRQINNNLRGSGGKNLIAKEIANSLINKRIVLVPTGSSQDLSMTNINDLLKNLMLRKEFAEVQEKKEEKKTEEKAKQIEEKQEEVIVDETYKKD
ncbi:MAG: SPFH domain-containing protein [Pseudomonadota bacterium]